MDAYEFRAGTSPVLVSMPHVGTFLPEPIRVRLTSAGKSLIDTDWDLARLYNFLDDLNASILMPTHSRYVIDLNRAPDNRLLYPGMPHSSLVPTETFDDVPLYYVDDTPTETEINERRERYWLPYHTRLAQAIADIKKSHGIVVLFDCHSIRSYVPRYMRTAIPNFNVGTADQTTCAPELRRRITGTLSRYPSYTLAVDARFKGGYIPRHYGAPSDGVHAFQLELSMATYMLEKPTPVFDQCLATRVREPLRAMLDSVTEWAWEGAQRTTRTTASG